MRSLFVVVVLITALVHQGTAQLPFGPVFYLSQYVTEEGGQQVVRLSAPILTSSPISFTGSIEVDIAAEDVSAEFWIDYIVNLRNPLSRIFTVAFQSRQANSTENPIIPFDDVAFEGRETFRLRIVEARFLGQAATVFRAQDYLNETTANVIIEDNDYIEVNWTISEPIEVIEGDRVEVRLRAEAFGIYANPIQIDVICAPTQVTGVPAASLGSDFIFAPGTRLNFTNVETNRSLSIEELVVPIRNDDIAEPCESFMCTLQGGALDAVRGIEPNRVTIRICDDDAVVVTFNEKSYTVEEIAGQVNVSLRIDGKFIIPVWAIVEIRDGTATDPHDYSSAMSYNVTFRQTAFTDGEDPGNTALSSPILIDIVNDDASEGVEYFQAHIVETSDEVRVRIGQDTVNVTINDEMSTFIQLLLRPVSDCLTWAETDSAAKLSDISAALSAPLQQQCDCSLSVQQSIFSCFETTDSQTVVFLAELSYAALPRVNMPSFLTSWVTSTPYITVASTQLQMDTTCPVVIDSLQPEPCSAVSVAPSTVPPADPTSNPATDSSTDATVIVVVVAVAVVVLLVMVTAIVAIVIAVIVFCSKQSKYSPRPSRSLPNPVHEEYEYMDNESWGMAMTSMTKNPSYTTTKEVLASFMFNGEEDEADHTYEVLPFEADEGDPDNPTHSGQETTADNPACE